MCISEYTLRGEFFLGGGSKWTCRKRSKSFWRRACGVWSHGGKYIWWICDEVFVEFDLTIVISILKKEMSILSHTRVSDMFRDIFLSY